MIVNSMVVTRRQIAAAAALTISGALFAPAFGKRRADGTIIKVRAAKGAVQGRLRFKGREYACALGRSGIVNPKHEGDGGTPSGRYPLREVRYRPDRIAKPNTGLAAVEANPTDGWCDDPVDPAYNRLVGMPYPRDAEVMWRDDHVYDLLAVIGYNDAPPVPGAGSAIFLHVARLDTDGNLLPTAGCVAMRLDDLLTVLAACTLDTIIDIRMS
jgi:L,D-peptidoglycan transpeptidase YkuD (ErfK/YbiS/YcfS/YnhG family)